MSGMTPLQIEELIEIAPQLKYTLNWMTQDAIKRNDQTKPGDYSDDLKLAILNRDLLRIIVE